MHSSEPCRYLRLKAVQQLVPLSRSTIYDGIKKNTFPAPEKLGQRAVAWREDVIVLWLQSRPLR